MRDIIEQLTLVGLVVICAIAAWADLTDQYKTCTPPIQAVPAQHWRHA